MDFDKKYFSNKTILIPPVNCTGILHIGHLTIFTCSKIFDNIYNKGQRNYFKGIDHAGIATEIIAEKEKISTKAVSEKYLKILKPSVNNLLNCFSEDTYFTLDKNWELITLNIYDKLIKNKIAVRGNSLVKWNTFLNTSVSDNEVKVKTTEAVMYTINYMGDSPSSGDKNIHVKTTRIDTIPYDICIITNNPEDHLKYCINPYTDKRMRIIYSNTFKFKNEKIIQYVKLTPSLDTTDYLEYIANKEMYDALTNNQMGDRYTLKKIDDKIIFIDNETELDINSNDFKNVVYKKIQNHIIKEEKVMQQAPFVESVSGSKEVRLKEVYTETILLKFTDDIKNKAIKHVEDTVIEPSIYKKQLIENIKNFKDWNIFKNRTWGISAYLQDSKIKGVFDCWLSSSICAEVANHHSYKFSTKSFNTKDGIVLFTGNDILEKWVLKMYLVSAFVTPHKNPFCFISVLPLIKGEDGLKMSKSIGNTVNVEDLDLSSLARSLFVLQLFSRDRFSRYNNQYVSYARKLERSIHEITKKDGSCLNDIVASGKDVSHRKILKILDFWSGHQFVDISKFKLLVFKVIIGIKATICRDNLQQSLYKKTFKMAQACIKEVIEFLS